jgi:hypothetical protein
MKRITILLFTICFAFSAFAYRWIPRHYVIIDTDAGVADMKAIAMLLASPDVRVLAITVSPGVLNSQTGYTKVKSLLNGFYHEGVPVGINSFTGFKSPDFTIAKDAKWGDEKSVSASNAPDYIAVLREIFAAENHAYSYNLNDDAIPVYLHYPELFHADTTAIRIEATPGETTLIREKTLLILKGETVAGNQVITEFLLTVKNDPPLQPSAEFTYMNRKIRLTLKPEIASVISNELKEINFGNGLDSDIYWELVRKNSIKYWLKLDRHDIFFTERL